MTQVSGFLCHTDEDMVTVTGRTQGTGSSRETWTSVLTW